MFYSTSFSVSECVLCLECKVYHLQSNSFLRQPKTSYSFCSLHNNWHTNLDSIFKSRDITLPTKVRLVKAMVFSVVMYGCQRWTIKKAELKNWCFWTVVLEKTLESPLDCKEIQSILKDISPEYLMFGHGFKESFGGGNRESGFIFLSSWKYGDGCQDQLQCRKLMITQAFPFLGSSRYL